MKDEKELSDIELSIVAPAFNEKGNLRQLVEESLAAGRAAGGSFEIIIANDASTDGTSALLEELMGEVPELRVIDMETRSGQTAACGCPKAHRTGAGCRSFPYEGSRR